LAPFVLSVDTKVTISIKSQHGVGSCRRIRLPAKTARLERLCSKPGELAKNKIYQKNCQNANFRVIIQGFADHSEPKEAGSPRVGSLEFLKNIQPISVGV